MPAKFPKRAEDGSFCVRVIHSLDSGTGSPQLPRQLESWLAAWLLANRYWEFGPRTLDFLDDFKGAPHSLECSGAEISYLLDGRPTSKWWRDWLAVRLVPELHGAFPGIVKVLRVVNA